MSIGGMEENLGMDRQGCILDACTNDGNAGSVYVYVRLEVCNPAQISLSR